MVVGVGMWALSRFWGWGVGCDNGVAQLISHCGQVKENAMLLGLTPNTLRKIIAIAGLVALRVESMPLAEFDPSTLVMLGWGSYSLRGSTTSECPSIDGKYATNGDEYSVMNDGAAGTKVQKNTMSPVVFFSHSHATKERPSHVITELTTETEQTSQDMFTVRQNARDGLLEFRMIAPRDAKKAVKATLQIQLGDYSCANGKVNFVSKSFENRSEGVTSNYQAKSFVTILTDGSLFYYESSRSVSQSLFIFSGSRTIQRYIRFLPRN